METQELLKKINDDLGMLSKNASLAYWNLATTGEEAHAKELEKSEIELKTYLSNRELFEEIKETLETHQEGLDPTYSAPAKTDL